VASPYSLPTFASIPTIPEEWEPFGVSTSATIVVTILAKVLVYLMNQYHSGRLRSLPLKRFCALYLLLLILFTTSIRCSQSTDATISGLVVDPSGNDIADADIEILNADTGVLFSSKTKRGRNLHRHDSAPRSVPRPSVQERL